MITLRTLSVLFSMMLLQYSSAVFAQRSAEVRDDTKIYSQFQYEASLEEYLHALSKKPNDSRSKYFAGICLLQLEQVTEALDYFNQINPDELKSEKGFYYWRSVAFFFNGKLKDAETALKIHQAEHPNILSRGSVQLMAYITNMKALSNKESIGFIENLGESINTPHSEYSAVLSEDHRRLFFTTKRVENKGGTYKGELTEDIMEAQLDEKDLWNKPSRLKRLATVGHDATVQLFDHDTKLLLFKNEDLFISNLNGDNWGKPEPLGKHVNHSNSRESHAAFSPDGQYMIYASDFQSKSGDLDLYICKKKENGKWGDPRFIEELNSDFDEDAPFIAADGTLYFSSNGAKSIGGFDIFSAHFNESLQRYEDPKNMGLPINSVGDDIFFTIKGPIAYFTSNRLGGIGADDIYRAYLLKNVEMNGTVINTAGDEGEYTVELLVNNQIISTETNNGIYRLKVPVPSIITARIMKNGEKLFETSFQSKISLQAPHTIKHDFIFEHGTPPADSIHLIASTTPEAVPIQEEIMTAPQTLTVTGQIIEKENGTLIPAKVFVGIAETGEVFTTFPSADGTFSLELPVGKIFVFQAEKSGYSSDRRSLLAELGTNSKVTIGMDKNQPKVLLAAQNVYFDFDKSSLTSKSISSLDSIIDVCKKHQLYIIEMTGHTDGKGDNAYNLKLSDKRVQAVKDYFMSKGIAAEYLVKVVGYGEDRPLASNDDDEGRGLNRRVEVRAVKNQE